MRGPTAAAKLLNPERDDHVPKTDNMERIHGIDHTEPGAIAGACVLAILGKSPDVCLHPPGDHTNIDYERLRKKSPSILSVFSEWDRVLFPDAEVGHGDPQKKQRGTRTMEAETQAQGGCEPNGENEKEGQVEGKQEGGNGEGTRSSAGGDGDASESGTRVIDPYVTVCQRLPPLHFFWPAGVVHYKVEISLTKVRKADKRGYLRA
ncbi:hypothetical protein B0H11DRAFT_2184391 [Mycena galericulata]|nr:hypothetical protein B0H11DRAFT_2184391 [Mycena galericulata]